MKVVDKEIPGNDAEMKLLFALLSTIKLGDILSKTRNILPVPVFEILNHVSNVKLDEPILNSFTLLAVHAIPAVLVNSANPALGNGPLSNVGAEVKLDCAVYCD